MKIALCDNNKEPILDYQQKISVIAAEQAALPTFSPPHTSGERLLSAYEYEQGFDLISAYRVCIALEWGSKGHEFESRHSGQKRGRKTYPRKTPILSVFLLK